MKNIIIKDSIPLIDGICKNIDFKNIDLLSFNNIKIIDVSSGIYSCDVFMQTWSFRVELFDIYITEIEFIKIRNNLTSILENKVSLFEFEQIESLFKFKIEKNSDFINHFELFVEAKDLYYGSMSIQTNIEYNSLSDLIKQLNEKIEPIDEKLWKMSNSEIDAYLINKWSQEGYLK